LNNWLPTIIIVALVVGIVITFVTYAYVLDQEIEEKQTLIEEEIKELEQELTKIKESESFTPSLLNETEPMSPEKIEALDNHWAELDAKRAETPRVKPANYQQDVIKSFESGSLDHIQSCDDLDSWYKFYHGGYDWSRNKDITDYLKQRMSECTFRELPELKERIDAERERIANATEKVMKELEEVYAEN